MTNDKKYVCIHGTVHTRKDWERVRDNRSPLPKGFCSYKKPTDQINQPKKEKP